LEENAVAESHQEIRPPTFDRPLTRAVARALATLHDPASAADLLFLERWEASPLPGTAAALRVGQIRRANPALAAEIRAELARRRPDAAPERRVAAG
jgi:hypothetical protein